MAVSRYTGTSGTPAARDSAATSASDVPAIVGTWSTNGFSPST
ncbi:MAG TPA: hypothetical protein VMO26_05650 [Vicinamibacterales bacterium]|nr:hypothetical protein [Vicinamibacterales bacterium]